MAHRASRPARERAIRSRLCQLIQGDGVIHGSLVQMARVCGNAGCRCQRGAKHVSWYLAVSTNGHKRMSYIPSPWERRVREWVQRYQDIRGRLEALSECHWQQIRQRQR